MPATRSSSSAGTSSPPPICCPRRTGAAASRAPDGAPRASTSCSRFIARRRPRLRCYILTWDYAALYTLERDPFSRWRLGWRMPRQIRFGFDDRHPVGGSHHQKVLVVDDQLAFCGGIDLTGHRWDTSAHRVESNRRRVSAGSPYEPYHEVQAMVSGPPAASLGVLARDRWRALGEDRLPPHRPLVRRTRSVAGGRPRRPHRRRRRDRPDDARLRDGAGRPRVRGAVPGFDCDGEATHLHRKPVLHQRPARRRAGRAAEGTRWSRGAGRHSQGMPRLDRAEHDGGVSRRRLPRADCGRHPPAAADRVSDGLPGAERAHFHPLEGDGRRR